jgi:fibronectin type 3 domain-containing protein
VTLNPGQTLSLQLQFQPTVAGTATGQLTITSNSLGGGSMVVPLSGLATAVAHEVDLSWLPPASSPDPVVGYNIYRSVSGGEFVRLNSAVSLPTTYVDSTVVSSVSYSYVAKSVDANGVESTASNEYQVTIP